MARLLRTSIALTALAAALAFCPRPAAGSWMTPPYGTRAKDFALVKHDGEFHVFYIRREIEAPFEETEVDFGHAVSTDLYVWNHLPPVLGVRDSSWDRHHVWAPSIVRRDGVYFMFYTGVTDEPPGPRLWQRTGIATSTDLMNWNRLDQPIMTCASVPWSVCDSMNAAMAFRDPCVVPDVVQPGRWLMVYSAFAGSDPTSMVAGLATSSGDFLEWQDHSPLWITHRPITGNGLVESPSLFEHDGLYYLFFTTSHLEQLRFAVTPDPAGDPGLWSYRGSLAAMLGLDTSAWFASEHLKDGLVDYFAFVNGDRVDVREIEWEAGGTFSLRQPDVFHIVRMRWSADSAQAGDTLVLTIESTNGYGRPFPYEVLAVAPDGSESLIAPSEMGVAEPPTLWSSTVEWTWTLHTLPDTLPGGVLPRLVVRTTDRTCESRALHLRPGGPPEYRAPRGGSPFPRPLGPGGGASHDLRQLAFHEFGARPSLLVEMPEAAAARLDLFDLGGRRVRTLADRVLDVGAHVIEWDGRDRDGRSVPRGLYFARLISAGRSPLTTRVLVR